MSLRQFLVSVVVLLVLVPTTVIAQTPETSIPTSGIAELAFFGAIIYLSSVVFSLIIGILILIASEVIFSNSYVRSIENRIYDRPIQSGVIGVGACIGGFAGFILLLFGLLFLTEFGVPQPISLVAVIPFFGGMVFLYVASTLGTIVLGSYVLRQVGDGESNLWLALVVGALVVNVPILNFVLAFLVLFLGTGAMVGQWWNNRRDESTGDLTASS